MLRSAFALGGLGSGVAQNETELRAIADNVRLIVSAVSFMNGTVLIVILVGFAWFWYRPL